MFIFAALIAVHVSLAGTIPTAPENITVTFINPQSVRISWQIASNYLRKPIEKYIVTFKPSNDRVVQQVAGHSEAVVLDHLLPNTQYQLSVTAVVSSHRYKSRQVIFKTLELVKGSSQNNGDSMAPHSGHSLGIFSDSVFTTTTGAPPNATTRELPTIRGVEVGIVVLVLIVWAGAIALFFNRWGKIRMLLPYQPDYKQEQLKVPGTGVCAAGSCNGQHSHQDIESDMDLAVYDACQYITPENLQAVVSEQSSAMIVPDENLKNLSNWRRFSLRQTTLDESEPAYCHREITAGYVELLQKIQDDFYDEMYVSEHYECECEGSEIGSLVKPQTKLRHFHYLDEPSTTIADRCTRNRINSAIFVSSEGRGFDSIEFLRRHGSQSVLCRKARSAENISDDDRKRRFSENQRWGTEDSSHPSETIELVECHTTPTAPPAPTVAKITSTPFKLAATANAIATAINKANNIVGSISIEAPPFDQQITQQQPLQAQHQQAHPPPQHQNTSSSTGSQNQTSSSANSSPVRLSLKAAKPPVTNLPTLSISQPSPPAEGEFL